MKSLPRSFARSWQLRPNKVCVPRALAVVQLAFLRAPVLLLPVPRTLAGTPVSMAADLRAAKQALRKELRAKLAALDDDAIASASRAVAQKLFELPEYQQSKGVACFMSMPKEFNTRPILERIFQDGKRAYLPRVESVKEHTMSMLEASSLADIDAFPPGRWNIPEPARDGPVRVEACDQGSELDLIVVPGLAFDQKGGRLGQGAGFYDRYLAKIQECKGAATVKLVGVTLDELMIAEVPRDDLDFLMHTVLWPSKGQ